MDFLKSAVASAIAAGSSQPFTFEDKVDIDQSSWTLHNGTKRVRAHADVNTIGTDLRTGRRREMQYLFFRYTSEQVAVASCEECATKITDVATSGSGEGTGHGRSRYGLARLRLA